jgi:lipopolysaccharide transport system ATP-binding protein
VADTNGSGIPRVAMVGTFDAANFGDVLFPVIAANELGARLGEFELTVYGYRNLSADHWPYAVRSLGRLPDEIGSYDLLLIGGGQVIRDDPNVAPGYTPSDPRVHEPLGLWLVPALLAHAHGVPVAFNAVGAGPALAEWLAPLARAALLGSRYVAVRDKRTATLLAAIAPDAAITVVPDTAFGAPAIVNDEARAAARELLIEAGIGDRDYVLVQSARDLGSVRDAFDDLMTTVREQDLAVVELPVGPVLGDHNGAVEIGGAVAAISTWPPPQVIAALIAGASAVVHESLHAGVVGFASSVPCVRREMLANSKHDQLNGLPGVHVLGQNGAAGAITRRRDRPDTAGDTARQVLRGALSAHWDEVAALVGRRGQTPDPVIVELLTRLPGFGESSSRERDGDSVSDTDSREFEAAYRAFADRAGELEAELAVARQRIEYLERRDATLERVLNGGWWQLRERLRPLLRLTSRSR